MKETPTTLPASPPPRGVKRLSITIGSGGARGRIAPRGACDEELVVALGGAVDRLLSSDIGELWMDIRELDELTPLGYAALLRCRRRAGRLRVPLVLVLGPAAADGLEDAGLLELFRVSDAVPLDLDGHAPAPPAQALRDADRRPAIDVPRERRRVPLLLEDPDLAAGLTVEQLDDVRHTLTTPTLQLTRGAWDGDCGGPPGAGAMGVLLLDTMLVRRVGAQRSHSAEILGPGDVLSVDAHPGEDHAPWYETSLRVLQPGTIAILDAEFTLRLASCPAVAAALAHRIMARSHAFAAALAAAHFPRIEHRVLHALWHLAHRWGRVTTTGVVLDLPLTHALIADVIAARRPSVTLALRELERNALVSRAGTTYVLHGEPPEAP